MAERLQKKKVTKSNSARGCTPVEKIYVARHESCETDVQHPKRVNYKYFSHVN
jgi:hypothetical protein